MQAAAQLEQHRVALTGHCYRMLGSLFEADDAVQETMVRAWKALDSFDGRASMKTWMMRIATNVCVDTLASRSRRARPMEVRRQATPDIFAPATLSPACEACLTISVAATVLPEFIQVPATITTGADSFKKSVGCRALSAILRTIGLLKADC